VKTRVRPLHDTRGFASTCVRVDPELVFVTVSSLIKDLHTKPRREIKVANKARYHYGKIYVPMDVRRALDLREGDEVEFSVIGEHEARVVVKEVDADRKLLELLRRPRKLGIRGKPTREGI